MLALGRLKAKLLNHTDPRIEKLHFLSHQGPGWTPCEHAGTLSHESTGLLPMWRPSLHPEEPTTPAILRACCPRSVFARRSLGDKDVCVPRNPHWSTQVSLTVYWPPCSHRVTPLCGPLTFVPVLWGRHSALFALDCFSKMFV